MEAHAGERGGRGRGQAASAGRSSRRLLLFSTPGARKSDLSTRRRRRRRRRFKRRALVSRERNVFGEARDTRHERLCASFSSNALVRER